MDNPVACSKSLRAFLTARIALGEALRKNKSVVHVLQNWAGSSIKNRMTDVRKKRLLVQQPFQNISNNYEQIGRERISLAQAVAAADPSTGDTIKQDRRFTGTKEIQNPVTPKRGEAAVEKNLDQAIPINRVKGLMEIKLQNYSRRGPMIAAV